MNLKESFSIGGYSEATQEQDVHLTLVYPDGDTFVQMFPSCRCKDFFNEVFYKIFYGKDKYIYGFDTKDIDIDPIKDSEYFYLLMVPRIENIPVENIVNFLALFGNFDIREMEINNLRSCVVKFHRNWADRPYLLSIFINLCRIGTIYTQDSWEEFKEFLSKNTMLKSNHVSLNCISQVVHSLRLIEDCLNGVIYEQSYKDYKDTSSLHNNAGSVAFSQKIYNNK